MRFTYRWGQRPLDGYTIKRGLGQGGFGEVYFAVSDGGKEVALKLLVRGRTDTELRGISTCLNLKHPNLVHLYDLKTDERGDHWLVMEYVHGEPLSTVLARHPKGLPTEQARDWFLQVARAVAYLHDHAVIHRDIKPGNVFVENGVLKLGDYGLSKSVSNASLTQSANVGTIYYMAPEVGRGSCTKQVDIYACGVMFYEMLTGEVPFRGESWAEVALRHQMDKPALDRIPPEFLQIVEKALSKRPEDRYADMNEMIAAIEAVSRVGTKAATAEQPMVRHLESPPAGPAVPPPLPRVVPPPLPPAARAKDLPIPSPRERLGELAVSLASAPVAAVAVPVVSALAQAVFRDQVDWFGLIPLYVLTVVASWAILVPAKIGEGRKSHWPFGIWGTTALGAVVGVISFWLAGWTFPTRVTDSTGIPAEELYLAGTLRATPGLVENLVGQIITFVVAFGLMSWTSLTRRYREDRVSIWPMFGTAFGTFFLWLAWKIILPSQEAPWTVFFALLGTSFVLQAVSPWSPRPPALPKRRRLAQA